MHHYLPFIPTTYNSRYVTLQQIHINLSQQPLFLFTLYHALPKFSKASIITNRIHSSLKHR